MGKTIIAAQHCTWVPQVYVHNSLHGKIYPILCQESRFVNIRASMNPMVKLSQSNSSHRFETWGYTCASGISKIGVF